MDIGKPSSRIHPLVATAAVAVTLVSLIGVAAITGLLPASNSTTAPANQAVAPNSVAAAPPLAQPAPHQRAPAHAPAATRARTQQPTSGGNLYAAAPQSCANCGEVEAVRAVQHTPTTSGVGIAAGAVLGGVLGNQVGGGTGRTLATVAGAVGGGYAGNEVEKHSRTSTSYLVDVRMQNGKVRSFPQTSENWRAGDQVRVINGRLTPRG